MSRNFPIKRGATSPSLEWQLEDPDKVLTGATVLFSMRRLRGTTLTVDEGVGYVVTGAAVATVRYEWATGDTAEEGTYQAEFKIINADTTVEITPREGYIVVEIGDHVN